MIVQLPALAVSGYQVYLHDLFGRTLYQEEVTSGASSVDINMSTYEHGIYYIELRATGVRGIQKIVKQGLE